MKLLVLALRLSLVIAPIVWLLRFLSDEKKHREWMKKNDELGERASRGDMLALQELLNHKPRHWSNPE